MTTKKQNVWREFDLTRKLLATSAIEGEHRLFNKLVNRPISYHIGFRIMEFHLVKRIIAQGQKFNRIPDLDGMDIYTLLCMRLNDGTLVPETPASAWAWKVLNGVPSKAKWTHDTDRDGRINRWRNVFNIGPISPDIKADVVQAGPFLRQTIVQSISRQAECIENSKMQHVDMLKLLNLDPPEAQTGRVFNIFEKHLA